MDRCRAPRADRRGLGCCRGTARLRAAPRRAPGAGADRRL